MNAVKEIFTKYNDKISRTQYQHFYPVSTLHMNDENYIIEFILMMN
jgi:hypothetical protein